MKVVCKALQRPGTHSLNSGSRSPLPFPSPTSKQSFQTTFPISSYRVKLLAVLLQMSPPIVAGSLPFQLIECGIERLTVGKAYHRTDFFHVLGQITPVNLQVRRFTDAVFIDQT